MTAASNADRQRAWRDRQRGGAARELQPCGTVAAARRHQRAGEPFCDACTEAWRQHQAAQYRARLPITYRHVGVMSYDLLVAGEVVGHVQRVRGGGWDGRTAAGTLVVEDYPGSRATAAGNVRRCHDEEVAAG